MPKLITVLTILVAAPLVSVAQSRSIEGIGPVGDVVKVRGDFQFIEGPSGDADGNLYFTDIPAERIYKLNAAGDIRPFFEPSGHTNGTMLHGKRLLVCQMDGRLASIDLDTKTVEVLADSYNGKRFNAPNDLVIDRSGGIYFTDPRFRAPEPWPQGTEAVYYRAADGTVTRLVSDVQAPNGIILSPDEKTLYVIPSREMEMRSYRVIGPGNITGERVFCTLKQPVNKNNTGGDGLTIDTKGNLYITSGLGIQVYDPNGKHLGIIEFPEQPANVTFAGPDRKTLYVTARTGLYSARMKSQGHVFPGN